ncbi:LexA family transcriptional regulator [Flavobacterium silvaticum]|uniref:HTH cro/C1-type domain-containing protein n=1 Tax=Flavobacterium silvaticum TaxID=1852020 RepID=A0A972FKK5_9FLAO|nr:helix-turn-helix domain-containing protein [Flavobacterium silvaticum]NMH27392.1 hypothetical protein [Flavobacterium silvaticum]
MQENNSQNANNVIKRLKSLLKVKTDIELSELLNIKPNTISTWKKRNSLDYETIISICELYELDLNALFLDKKPVTCATSQTPLISREVQFQYASGADRENLMEIVPKFSFPFLTSHNTLAFQVVSSNMYPVLVENSFVLCEESSLESIKDGQIALVVTNNKGIFLNRLEKSSFSEGHYSLRSENDFFTDITLLDQEIKECWVVRGVVSYDLNIDSRFQYVYDSFKKIDKFFKDKKSPI